MAKLPWYLKQIGEIKRNYNGCIYYEMKINPLYFYFIKIKVFFAFIFLILLEKIRGFDLIEKVKRLKNF